MPKSERKLTIASLMFVIAIIALITAWGVATYTGHRRINATHDVVQAWRNKQFADSKTYQFLGFSAVFSTGLTSTTWQETSRYRTTPRNIVVVNATADSRESTVLKPIEISFGEKTITIPVADVLRGKTLDLRERLPEAFR